MVDYTDPAADSTNWVGAFMIVLGTLAIVLGLAPQTWHWFVVPVTMCGLLIGIDAVAWARRQLETFDPRGILGVFGLLFFFVAPLLHVGLDYFAPYFVPRMGWREALGTMAVLNLVGLSFYRHILALPPRGRRSGRSELEVNESRLTTILFGWMLVGLGAIAYQFVLFDGVSGYLSRVAEGRTAYIGTYAVLLPADTFPLTALTLVLLRWRRQLGKQHLALALVFLAFVAVQFLVSGLRGSRSATVWPVLIGLILINVLVVRVSRKLLAVCLTVFLIFMFVYGIYKSAGTQIAQVVNGRQSIAELSTSTGRTVPALILMDLGRADVQAMVLDRKLEKVGELGYGRSYLGDVSVLVPRVLLHERPPSKIYYGTITIWGPRSFDFERGRWISRVYGIAGEAMLNFGPWVVPLAMIILALLVRWSSQLYQRALDDSELAPKLLAPPVTILVVLMLAFDLDNITILALTRLVPIAAAVYLSLQPRADRAALKPTGIQSRSPDHTR